MVGPRVWQGLGLNTPDKPLCPNQQCTENTPPPSRNPEDKNTPFGTPGGVFSQRPPPR